MTNPSPYPSNQEIWDLARRLGLDPYPTHFELVPAAVLYEFAAYLMPGRMRHWTLGKSYHLMRTRYDYGLQKLYEMVVNTNPAYAFLLDSNSDLENTFVRCHVMGHVDFFKHNQIFWHTSGDMMDRVTQHADRARQYEFTYGVEAVESVLDAALALGEQVAEPQRHFEARSWGTGAADNRGDVEFWDDIRPTSPATPQESHVKWDGRDRTDVLAFLADRSPVLEDWQRDLVSMVHSEMVYFWPQIRTKIMNEGWATFWHLRLMRELPLTDADYVNFSRLHASVTGPIPYQVNPYGLGHALFEHIAQSEGLEAAFFAREVNDDVSFVRNYLNQAVVEDQHLYVYGLQDETVRVETRQWEIVREHLVQDLTHGGIPVLSVEDDDFNQRGGLYLKHQYEGIDLDLHDAELALKHVVRLWGKPVYLETRQQGRRLLLSHDGKVASRAVL